MREVVNPAQVILVTARGTAKVMGRDAHKDNIITLAWHSPLSFDPELYGICVGKTRFSCGLIDSSKVFAVNFIPHELKEKAMFCGRNTGATTDKFARSGLTKQECDTIDCCRLAEASAVLECEVIDQSETGDHLFFVGKVLKTISRNDKKRLIYLGTERFTTTI
ncbi:flavin reductase family protein [Candidatus Woesearchaeota archaeon]|nr:flavin reductase family protein [Candidatus Woesearchaeota archaeon]